MQETNVKQGPLSCEGRAKAMGFGEVVLKKIGLTIQDPPGKEACRDPRLLTESPEVPRWGPEAQSLNRSLVVESNQLLARMTSSRTATGFFLYTMAVIQLKITRHLKRTTLLKTKRKHKIQK